MPKHTQFARITHTGPVISVLLTGGIALLILIGNPSRAVGQDHVGQYEQADIEFGVRLYGANCLRCHAETGDAVAGVDLRSGAYNRASSDRELMELLRTGIPGTAMPPNNFSDSELTGLVSYLRTMRDIDLSAVALGDNTRGSVLFTGKGACATCHRVNGLGPRTAPDLSDIGSIRTAATLQRSLLDPTGSMLPINRPVSATLSAGTVINGRRLNEDTYTIQVIDQDERLRSLDKSELRELSALTESPMPPATELLDTEEIADLLAYLLTLKGLE